MQPGEEQEIVFAVVWAQGEDRLDSVRRLRDVATGLRARFDQLMRPYRPTPAGPPGPSILRFGANYPNPFRGTTTIRYALPDAARVRLSVYDVLGRERTTLIEADQEAGVYEVVFDAEGLPAGVYFCRIEIAGRSFTHAMIVQ